MAADLADLRRNIIQQYSHEEFKTLCFDLGVRYDLLPGESYDDKARELILFLDRRGRLEELTTRLQSNPFPRDETTGRYYRIRANLVEKVRVIWLRGVLDQSLYEVARLELGLAERPSA